MKNLKYLGLLLVAIVAFLGWLFANQLKAVAVTIGLPVSHRLSVTDQYILS
ncbi:MAG: hypothetical protein JW757_06385 [Anaerolineales bacterium]|nr:hypothetical protein [Anaerolineales bacterium]